MEKKTKILLEDADDKSFMKSIRNTESNIKGITKEIDKIRKCFDKVNAQERYLLLDVLIGNILNYSKMSPSIMSAILFKYLLVSTLPSMMNIPKVPNKIIESDRSYLG